MKLKQSEVKMCIGGLMLLKTKVRTMFRAASRAGIENNLYEKLQDLEDLIERMKEFIGEESNKQKENTRG